MNKFSGRYVLPFEDLRMDDVDVVGGKNASLGEMISQLSSAGVKVPTGHATTAEAFHAFLAENGLTERIAKRLDGLDVGDVKELARAGAEIRRWVVEGRFPAALEQGIRDGYAALCADSRGPVSVAVRSSATAEDLPDASFAGQQESFLNVVGIDDVLHRVREVFASLYNDRAISYRVHKGFAHAGIGLSAGIQRMCRSDVGAAGVMFTLDTESGFPDVVFITSSYGLGETVVQGAVNPDEFYVHKPMLQAGHFPVIRRQLGSKLIRMEFEPDAGGQAGGAQAGGTQAGGTQAGGAQAGGTQAGDGTQPHAPRRAVRTVETTPEMRTRFSLTDDDVVQLAKYAVIIEQHYGRPMDIEWGKDGNDGQIFILQARPETVKANAGDVQQRFELKGDSEVLATGRAIGQKIGAGKVRIVGDASEMDSVQAGDVLVTDMTDPNWEPVMKKAAAIVTNRGGRTCHAAIIARELGIPAVVGCGDATERLHDGSLVTVSCAQGDTGYIYDGLLETEVTEVFTGELPRLPLKVMMNVGNPQLAFEFAQLPNDGVGLARLEFVINNNIGIHPKAILDYPNVDGELKKAVESVARGYASPRAFYVDKLAEGVATIAAAYWPRKVIVRLSDFKSNEYRKLIGGSRYEPEEENPMLGFRGASRYISADFAECFRLECEAMKRVRNDMGLTNVELMVPFVRTTEEAIQVIDLLRSNGLRRGEGGGADGNGALRIIMMCEIPSNALLAEEFLEHFDGFSIGSNDLTQLTLGLDRDSGLVAEVFDERDPAVRMLLKRAIDACRAAGKYVGICGQGPSDHPDLAVWLMEQGIDSVSLNPDTVVSTWQMLGEHLKKHGGAAA